MKPISQRLYEKSASYSTLYICPYCRGCGLHELELSNKINNDIIMSYDMHSRIFRTCFAFSQVVSLADLFIYLIIKK